MSVVFESLVKNDKNGGWYIELKDTVDGRVVVCKNLKEYEIKIQELSANYSGIVDDVRWISEQDLSVENMQSLRVAMMEYEEKYKENIEKSDKKHE